MNDKLKATAAALRLYIVALRSIVNKHVSSRSDKVRTAQRNAHEQLKFLVPLSRALAAITQQAGRAESKGGERYTACFQRMCAQLHTEFSYWQTDDLRQYEGMQGVCLLLPQQNVAAAEWPHVTMGKVFELVRQEIAEAQALRARQQRLAASTRATFLASLSVVQREALKDALQAARETGCHSVTIYDRDVR